MNSIQREILLNVIFLKTKFLDTCILNEFYNEAFVLSDSPRSVTISPSNDTFYTKPNDKPAQDITCKADCLPVCTYTWYRESENFTTGNNLFAGGSFDRTGSYRIRCHASNGVGSNSEMYSRWITVEVKGRIVCVPIFKNFNKHKISRF